MRPFRSVLFAAVTAIGLLHAGAVDAQPVSFQTKDDVTVFGDFRPALKEPRGTIVLFHMAGSNKSEYAPLAPVLNDAGFATLAIDQRSGGDFWGGREFDGRRTSGESRLCGRASGHGGRAGLCFGTGHRTGCGLGIELFFSARVRSGGQTPRGQSAACLLAGGIYQRIFD